MIVTTMIILLLVIVAVGIVWFVVRNVLTGSADEVSAGRFLIDLDITNAYIDEDDTNMVYISVTRNPGKGNLKGIKFIFSDGDNTKVTEQTVSMDELEQQTFNFNIQSLGIEGATEVSIAPITGSESGGEIQGGIIATRTLTLGEGGGILGGDDCVSDGILGANEICDPQGENCLANCICESNFVPVGGESIHCEASGVGGPTCDGVWDPYCTGDGITFCADDDDCTDNGVCGEDVSVECETTGLGCLTNCVCDIEQGYIPFDTKQQGCDVKGAYWTGGTVSSIWPGAAPRYFDSDQLPKDATISQFLDKYVKFTTGPEADCINIENANHVVEGGYSMSHFKLADVSIMVSGNEYDVWDSTCCGTPPCPV